LGAFIFAFLKFLPIFDPTNQIFLPFKGVWFLLRRAERLGSAKPWQPVQNIGKRCQYLIPGKPGDDKNKTRKNEFNSSDAQQFYHAAYAYVHAPVKILIWSNQSFSIAGSTR
jgi:hypothetical protein